MHFGAGLRLLRTEAGLSLRELSSTVGVSTAYLSRVEHGHDPPPTTDRLRTIADALGLPVDVLLDLSGRLCAPSSAELPATHRQLLAEISRRGLGHAQVARILDFVDREFPHHPAEHRISLLPLLPPERVLLGVRVRRLDDALDLAALQLTPPGEAGALAAALRAREQSGPSTVGGGLCLPHAPGFSPTPAACLIVLSEPLSTSTPDDLPLRVLLVLTGLRARDLLTLARASRLAEPTTLEALCAAPDVDALRRRIQLFDQSA